MKCIELFAGCGGLSVGLESIGFELVFANELSPMAGETYAYNLLGEDLKKLGEEGQQASNVLWISSKHDRNNLSARLRENPQEAPPFEKGRGDLAQVNSITDIDGKLLVGSIVELNRFLKKNKKIADEIEGLDVDLVSGGPPCQSFSLAGLRQHDNARNTLPMDFADFVGIVRPKIALLENVSGILRAFNLPDGKHYAWFEVARAFASKNYYPLCLHVNAKNACAAQNRPRFIMLAMRDDVFNSILAGENENELKEALKQVKNFCEKKKPQPFLDLRFHDIEKEPMFFKHPILKSLNQCPSNINWHTVKDAIDDLSECADSQGSSKYLNIIKRRFPEKKYNNVAHKTSHNHEHRSNNALVQRRFRVYQVLANAKTNDGLPSIEKEVIKFLKDPLSFQLSQEVIDYLTRQLFLPERDAAFTSVNEVEFIKLISRKSIEKYLKKLATKKQTQRALIASSPAPAALSIPDDACHYKNSLFRTLTVREMARFQSFPDWFEFRSKVTTGGQMRRYEVPQYTQVGNAVPPLLGRALGEVINKILVMS
jgi:DNA (cytosine-5)-methyltransferase 1